MFFNGSKIFPLVGEVAARLTQCIVFMATSWGLAGIGLGTNWPLGPMGVKGNTTCGPPSRTFAFNPHCWGPPKDNTLASSGPTWLFASFASLLHDQHSAR
jgi:hypothetical protein